MRWTLVLAAILALTVLALALPGCSVWPRPQQRPELGTGSAVMDSAALENVWEPGAGGEACSSCHRSVYLEHRSSSHGQNHVGCTECHRFAGAPSERPVGPPRLFEAASLNVCRSCHGVAARELEGGRHASPLTFGRRLLEGGSTRPPSPGLGRITVQVKGQNLCLICHWQHNFRISP